MNNRQKAPAFFTTLSIVCVCACLLTSCESVLAWARAEDSGSGVATVPADPSTPSTSLPTVGGGDPIDLLVTVLTVLGLVPAARVVALARPWLAALILSIWGKQKPAAETPTPPAS